MCMWNISHSPRDKWVCACKVFPSHRPPRGRWNHYQWCGLFTRTAGGYSRLVSCCKQWPDYEIVRDVYKCVTKITSLVLSIIKRNTAVARRNSSLNGVLWNLSGVEHTLHELENKRTRFLSLFVRSAPVTLFSMNSERSATTWIIFFRIQKLVS
jgi:hypothetical protein